jgi:hypothetical protein
VEAWEKDVRLRRVRPTTAEVVNEGAEKRGRLLIGRLIFIEEMDVCGFAIRCYGELTGLGRRSDRC